MNCPGFQVTQSKTRQDCDLHIGIFAWLTTFFGEYFDAVIDELRVGITVNEVGIVELDGISSGTARHLFDLQVFWGDG